jgi:hypothetical protein
MIKPEWYSEIIPSRWGPETVQARREFKCQHGHSGITHPNCYVTENGIQERKGCLDIEASGLKADFGIVLSWCIKTSGQDEYFYDHVTPKDFKEGIMDARIISTLIERLWKYDRLVTHYGGNFKFDIPFVRSRYLYLSARRKYSGDRFPGYGEMYVSDTYPMAKKLLAISSRRQGSIASTILGKDEKTAIERDKWMAIQFGTSSAAKDAIKYIVDHNIHDCSQLDENYLTLLPFVREVKSSI